MKKNIIFMSLLTAFLPLSAVAQVAEVTFDTNDYASIGVYDSWENSPFRNGQLQGNVAVIDNPYAEVDEVLGVAPNATSKVLAVQRSRYGSNQFGARINLKQPFSLKPEIQYVHVLVHRPVSGRVMLMGLGKHREAEWAGQSAETEQFWAISMTTVTPDRWVDAVFGIKGVSGVDIHSLVLVPECESPHDRTEDFIAYIDQIVVNNSSTPLVQYGVYPTNFDKETTLATRSDRGILSVGLQNVKTLTITSSPSTSDPIYREKLEATFPVKPGQSVKPVFGYRGTWMSGYLYVDYGKDGKFSYDINANGTPAAGSDIVSFSAYQTGGSWRNSAGTQLNDGNTLTMPNFTVPAGTPLGFYRMRFKVDWNNIDPAGNMADGNTIMGNGGGIVDVRLNVHADNVSVMEDNRNGEILNADGTPLVSTTPFGKAFTIKLNPENGFGYDGVRIRHGYNLTGDSLVYETPQYVDEIVYRKDFDDNDCYTVKAEWVDGDILLEGLFVEKGTEKEFNYPINYDKETAELNRNDRRLNGVTMGEVTYTLPSDKKVYHEDMTKTFFAQSGERLTVQFNYTGSWMNGFVYVDRDQDGDFSYAINSNGTPKADSDLMTYSHYNGRNSVGSSVSGSDINPPSFTLPALADGFYCIRFKVDWNEIDPGGNTTADNNIIHNGGGIADARLRVYSGSSVNLSVESAENGSLTAAGGASLPTTIPFNAALSVVAAPNDGFAIDTLYVTHGDLTGAAVIHSVPQRLTTVYTADDFYEGALSIPAEIIDGDVVLRPVFASTGIVGIKTVSDQPKQGEIYDLQGRKMSHKAQLPKGLYIKNGKKIVKS